MKKTLIETINGCEIFKVENRFLVRFGRRWVGKGWVSGGYASLEGARDKARSI